MRIQPWEVLRSRASGQGREEEELRAVSGPQGAFGKKAMKGRERVAGGEQDVAAAEGHLQGRQLRVCLLTCCLAWCPAQSGAW